MYADTQIKPLEMSANDVKVTSRALKAVVILILLVISYFFVSKMVEEYLEGRTNFSASRRPLSVQDVPTATICFKAGRKLIYGSNFLLKAFLPHTGSVQVLDRGWNKIKGQKIHLKQLVQQPEIGHLALDCIALNFRFRENFFANKTGNSDKWDRIFLIGFFKLYTMSRLQIPDGTLYRTSENNSYGATMFQWFDGEIEPFKLTKGFHILQIPQTRRYEFMERCSKESFFECVASKLISKKSCQVNNQLCSPLSLPSGKHLVDIPICQNRNESLKCWKEINEMVLPPCMAQKSCSVQEYSTAEFMPYDISNENEMATAEHVIKYYGGDRNVVNDLLDKPKESIVFSITFDHKDWSKGERSKYLVVDVYEEYQVWNGISLIGNIGGQMGLLVGFSFLGCSDWFIKIVPKAWKWATRSFKTSNDMEMAC